MEASQNSEELQKSQKLNFTDAKYATGKRKKSIARVWLKRGSGNIFINGKKMPDYFRTPNLRMVISRPLILIKQEGKFDIRCTVKGGGLSGQAGAVTHGISKALTILEPDLRSVLKKEKLTTRDSRTVERKKYGHRKARRSFQFSKR